MSKATNGNSIDEEDLETIVASHEDRLSILQDLFYQDFKQRLEELESEVGDLQDHVADLEAENQRLRNRISDSPGKDEKLAKIVRFAANARKDQPAVKLDARDIAGAAECSERYAYDLMDSLASDYDWILTPDECRQYGQLEMETDSGRWIAIDFEGVQSEGVRLNLFFNGSGGDPHE